MIYVFYVFSEAVIISVHEMNKDKFIQVHQRVTDLFMITVSVPVLTSNVTP